MVRGLLHRTPLASPQRSARGFMADHGALLVGLPPPRGPSPPRPSPHREPRVRRRGHCVRRCRSPRGHHRCKARRHEHVSRRRPHFVPKPWHTSRRHGQPVPAFVRFSHKPWHISRRHGRTPRGFALAARPHALAAVAPLRPQRHGAPPLCRRPRRCPRLRIDRLRPLRRRARRSRRSGQCSRKRVHPRLGHPQLGAPRPRSLARRSGAGHCTAKPFPCRGRGRAPRCPQFDHRRRRNH